MNIFEKLIDELKEENLLEETVIENNGNYKSNNKMPLSVDVRQETTEEILNDDDNQTGFEFKPSTAEDVITDKKSESLTADNELAGELPNTVEFFYRRAKEEVASLQMVELILSGVERDQMKIVPKIFDDLAVKTALHRFGKVTEDADSPRQSQAEFELMQKTENWYSALSQRDKIFQSDICAAFAKRRARL